MSDPVTQPQTLQATDIGAAIVIQPGTEISIQPGEKTLLVVEKFHASGDLFVTFHQLLI